LCLTPGRGSKDRKVYFGQRGKPQEKGDDFSGGGGSKRTECAK